MKKLFLGVLLMLMVFIPIPGVAGNIDSAGNPSAGSGMYTLLQLYNYFNSGTVPSISTSFQEPTAGPAGTMKTTKNIFDDTKAQFDQCDVKESDVVEGKKFFSTQEPWGVQTGTLVDNGPGTTLTPGTADQTIPAGYWSSENTVLGDSDLQSYNIRSGRNIFGVSGAYSCPPASCSGNAVSANVLSGKTFSNSSSVGLSGSMPEITPHPITPTISSQDISEGYHSGSGYVEGDPDLIEANIKKDVQIFGVTGEYVQAMVSITGQTASTPLASNPAGSDGAIQAGVPVPPSGRFSVSGNTVTDNLTELIWAKNAYQAGETKTWSNAITYCNDLALDDYTDWRLPNIKELLSLIDWSRSSPALPDDPPFANIQSGNYWSSSTNAATTTYAWAVSLIDGSVDDFEKEGSGSSYNIWPVRGGVLPE